MSFLDDVLFWLQTIAAIQTALLTVNILQLWAIITRRKDKS